MTKPKPKKTYQFTPESIRDELSDRINQGWSNDKIVRYYGDDTGPNLRRWLTSQRKKQQRFWDSMTTFSPYD